MRRWLVTGNLNLNAFQIVASRYLASERATRSFKSAPALGCRFRKFWRPGKKCVIRSSLACVVHVEESSVDEDALMARVVGGDTNAFGAIVRLHQRSLTRFAERLLGDAHGAQDVVQEAFVRIWQARATYRAQGCLRSMLFRTVHNLCLDHVRRSGARASASLAGEANSASAGSPQSEIELRALAEAVREAVQALPDKQRAVFVLSQYEQLSYPQIAQILQCPVGTVASRKRLALDTLRRKLSPWMDDKL